MMPGRIILAGGSGFMGHVLLDEAARTRLARTPGEPLFVADWARAVFMHFAVDADALQREVPFALDDREGRAFVSLVAFTMSAMRPRYGGKLGAWFARGFGESRFLNVRTYVRHAGETGIYFLAEWLSNGWSVPLGPVMFGLPYRFGRLNYEHTHESGEVRGRVTATGSNNALTYHANMAPDTRFETSEAGSLAEFLMERYTAFTFRRSQRRLFRVWHEPWKHAEIELNAINFDLLSENWPWFRRAEFIGANYSPGARNVWMGRPHKIESFQFAPR